MSHLVPSFMIYFNIWIIALIRNKIEFEYIILEKIMIIMSLVNGTNEKFIQRNLLTLGIICDG
jgi:hypothetical protein